MNWITNEGNYKRFIGGDKTLGRKKTVTMQKPSVIFRVLMVTRSEVKKALLLKLQRSKCFSVTQQIGSVTQAQNWTIHERLSLMSWRNGQNYDQSSPVMSDRPNSRPLYTNEERLQPNNEVTQNKMIDRKGSVDIDLVGNFPMDGLSSNRIMWAQDSGPSHSEN